MQEFKEYKGLCYILISFLYTLLKRIQLQLFFFPISKIKEIILFMKINLTAMNRYTDLKLSIIMPLLVSKSSIKYKKSP